MAGHRSGQPRRDQSRRERMRRRVGSATTGEEQLSAAFDRFRMAVRHDASPADRAALMRRAAEFLNGEATAIEGRADGHHQ